MENDPLVELGLIDPSTFDTEPGETRAEAPEAGETPGAATTSRQPTESDEAARLRQENEELKARLNAPEPAQSSIGGKSLQEDMRILQSFAETAVAQAIAANSSKPEDQRVPEATIRALADAHLGRLQAESQVFWDRQALRPVAVNAAAEKVARELSTKTVTLDAKDLADPKNYPDGALTVEAMRARAHALVNSTRDAKFADRVKRGADTVEGGAAPGSVDRKTIDSLDPFYKIKLGLKNAR